MEHGVEKGRKRAGVKLGKKREMGAGVEKGRKRAGGKLGRKRRHGEQI